MTRDDGSPAQERLSPHEPGRIISDSRLAAYGILISRITGFLRISTAGAVLGPTFFGNLFQTAAVLPSTLYSFLIGTLISALLVPPLVQCINGASRNSVRDFSNSALGLVTSLLLGIALVIGVAAPLVIRLMTLGVLDPEVRRHEFVLGVPLLLALMPQIVLYGVAGVGMAVQQAHKRFLLSSVTPAFENIASTGVLVAWAVLYGMGTETSGISVQGVVLLGTGTTFAVALHACIQWIGAWRLGVPLVPRFSWHDPALRHLIRKGGASIGFNGLYSLAYLILLVVAGAVPGGVTAFQVAYNLSHFPVALTAFPIAAAQLPRLAAGHDRSAWREFQTIYRDGLRLMNFAVVPAAVLLIAMPRSFAAVTAFGAMNTPDGITIIAICIASLGVGIIGEGTVFLATSSCYARQDTSSPLKAIVLRFAIVCAGAAIASLVFPPGHGLLWALGGSLACANTLAGVYLSFAVHRAVGGGTRLHSNGLLTTLAVASLSMLPAAVLSRWLNLDTGPEYRRVGLVGLVLVTSIIAYFVVQLIRGSPEARLLLPAFGSRRLKAQPLLGGGE